MRITLLPGFGRTQTRCGSRSCQANPIQRKSVGTVSPVANILALLGSLFFCGSVGADCIDYGDYLHRVGGVNTPGYARGEDGHSGRYGARSQ